MKAKGCSLREKKYARTKIAIMNAFMERLKHSRFEDISIKKVCGDAEVAEGTFFNYFPEKIDVIRYYLFLTTAKIVWKARRETPAGSYLLLIDTVFRQLAEEVYNNNLTYQIISVLLAQNERPRKITISALEKKLVFPDCPGIEETSPVLFEEWFRECVILAQKNGEIPETVNVDDLVISLMTIMCGTLLAIRFVDSDSRGCHYTRQLQALWRGVGAKERNK